MKIFVSYCHRQGDWVRDALVPVLRASGAEILIDWERLRAGYALAGEMDATQDQADRHVLAISAQYLLSNYCLHEMDRAIRLDPRFANGKTIPVKLDDAKLPSKITRPNPLYVDLRNAAADDQWQLLIRQCGGDLQMAAPAWIATLDKTKLHLDRNECVNVVVRGEVAWRAWLDELRATRFAKLAEVDLENPLTVPRPGLIREILRAAGRSRAVPAVPDDLPELALGLMEGGKSYVALRHFHRVADRPQYGPDLFSSLRYLTMDTRPRQLVLLAQTRQPVATLLPSGHELSKIDFKTVELG